MNIKRNITFKLEKRKNKGVDIVENVPIRMRVTYTGSRIDFSTGYRVDVAKWDDTVQRVKSKTTNKLHQTASEINDYLDEMRTELQKIFKEYEVKECIP
ncbi:Arm DNA-binding domain-containing protein, partial [uncultured Duncaniella sp.]